MQMQDSLGDRMKSFYEDRYRLKLTRRIPVIMRLDGRAFHSLTKTCCQKPFDESFNECMKNTAIELLLEIQGSKCAYIQSDEISILLTDFDKNTTDAFFDYNIQKMTSISSSIASVEFIYCFRDFFNARIKVEFDSRVFNIPKEEVCNYFIWRQKDWMRNSVQMLAQSVFSQKQLNNKSIPQIHEMLHEKNINWANLDPHLKNGIFINRKTQIKNDVIFTEKRDIFDEYLYPTKEEEK